MSGHSKWSKVKHQKEATDATKGKVFTKMASAIIIAVKEGGGITDPAGNFRLRLAIEKARAANMPKDNIERAIEKGAGKGEGINLQKVVYEAFGPGKIGIIIEATTDNHQRTTAEVKNILDRGGGILTAQGAVSYLFKYMGVIEVAKGNRIFDEVMEVVIEAGGEDLKEDGDKYSIYTVAGALHRVKENLEKKGYIISHADLVYTPIMRVKVGEEERERVNKLLESLENADDVLNLYSNLE